LEEKELSQPMEKLGEAIDTMHLLTNNLLNYYDEELNDCLNEYALFTQSVITVLKYRTHKQLELEDIAEQLNTKQNQLVQLESTNQTTSNFNVNCKRG
jgi:predicted RNA-binding protein Jag